MSEGGGKPQARASRPPLLPHRTGLGTSRRKRARTPSAAPKPSGSDGGLQYYKQEVGLSGWSQHVDDIGLVSTGSALVRRSRLG